METSAIENILQSNSYCGRGIIIGKSADAQSAVIAYFTMGRSENSRNRVFLATDDGITIEPFDLSKVADPSLIIYHPVRTVGQHIIVTNGDQTDTIHDFIKENKTFEDALLTRCFEPDAPNFTPRISGIITKEQTANEALDFSYKLSILKAGDAGGSVCSRYFYQYQPLAGIGHFIHTYEHDGSPIPSFEGEPRRVAIPNGIDAFADLLWKSLNDANKVSLYVSYLSLATGERTYRILNKLG
ncbi:MAG: IMP cyclohydrolase [Oscillospiraceae bacterium]|jgi:IMP cyclohydrolase|nr:IMP cyclohydrolase [Oscillospiraceae bacterium]